MFCTRNRHRFALLTTQSYSSHMIDLSEEEVDYNIQTTKKYLERAAPMKQWLEMVSQPSMVSRYFEQ